MKQRFNAYAVAGGGVAALVGVEKYVNESGLEHGLLHLIKTRASQMNGCAYCLHMHTSDARAGGESEARLYLLPAWRESAMYTPRERAALAWTEAMTAVADGNVSDAVYEEVRAQFSEKELADLTIAVAMINAWNRIAVASRSRHPHDKAAATSASSS
ncbi:MAG: carboxymuconolactone decarboxylase family protein [Alphaproteobacteria bacterium]|jgi:AhpD family alkylhydroperoxidase|nr:carboxymuconolactone decarboxylase family protein [Alphaproteobacteria bacterium]